MINNIPFFSVVIATYNRANLITRALKSLLAQTETDWEAIIVDDGSNDNTLSQLSPLLGNKKIRYYYFSHRGMVSAKNAGIRASRGKYITFLDSDDEYHPGHLATKRAVLDGNPELKLLYGKVKIIGSPYVPDRYDESKLIHIDQCMAGGNFVFESGALKKLKGYRELSFGVDADLFDRAVASGLQMAETRERTYIYHHETADSNTNRKMRQYIKLLG